MLKCPYTYLYSNERCGKGIILQASCSFKINLQDKKTNLLIIDSKARNMSSFYD